MAHFHIKRKIRIKIGRGANEKYGKECNLQQALVNNLLSVNDVPQSSDQRSPKRVPLAGREKN